MSSSCTLHVDDLTVAYRGRQVLSQVALPTLRGGELIALVGPNGAGKSPFLKALAGLVPASGNGLLNRANCLQSTARERPAHIGFLPLALSPCTLLTQPEATVAAWRR